MMTKIKNIIFDFDGTIADTSKLIVSTMQKSIQDYALPFRNEAQIKETIGVRLEEIPTLLWPKINDIGKPFAEIYRKNFEELKNKIPIELFPEVKGTLSKLNEAGVKMAIATSRSHSSVKELTEQLGIGNYFVYLLGGDDVSEGKPNPESIYKILDKMGWKSEKTMMVGDMMVDIRMGKNADVITCGVAYGNGKVLELEESGADYIIYDFPKLMEIINANS